jgi:PAS domain S-box-containing protein
MAKDRTCASPPNKPSPVRTRIDFEPVLDKESRDPGQKGLFKGDVDVLHAGEMLRVSSEQLSAIVDYVSDIVIVVDGDCNVCYVNPAVTKILGYTSTELVGMNWLTLVYPQDVQATYNNVHQGEVARNNAPVECRAMHRDGFWRWLEIKTTSLPAPDQLPRIAITARDVTDTKQMQERQTRLLLEATINGQEEERERICLDIHDGVCQTLATAFQYLETVEVDPGQNPAQFEKVQKAQDLVRQGARQAREIVASLRSTRLDALGLIAALRHDIRDLAERTGINVSFEADTMRLPSAIETALYRVVHEALNNIIKHAQATHVATTLRRERDELVVVVQDNGVGFPVERGIPGTEGRGIGLISMRRRTELLHGSFEVSSTAGKGSSICITVPLHAATKAN